MNSPHEGHVVEHVADFVKGRLDDATLAEVKAHLESCAECAADFAAAVVMHQASEAQKHLSAERISALSEPVFSMSNEEREHLESCDNCAHELDMLRGLGPAPSVAGLERELAPYREKRTARRATPAPRLWGWGAAAVAVAAALVLFLQPSPEGFDYSTLAALDPMPVRITRSDFEAGSFEEARAQALAAYGAAEYSRAQAQFDMALGLRNGDAEMLLYRASALALQGRLDDARDDLLDLLAAGGAVDQTMRDEASWQLVQIELMRGDRAGAEEVLDEVRGHREQSAQELRSQLQQLDE